MWLLCVRVPTAPQLGRLRDAWRRRYANEMHCGRQALSKASSDGKRFLGLLKRASISGTEVRWASTDNDPTPVATSTPDPLTSPPSSPYDIKVDEALTNPASIDDGWFNPNPVKLTPDCPGSMISLFVGRTIPQRMYLEEEEESTAYSKPVKQDQDSTAKGVGQFLVDKGEPKGEEVNSEQEKLETWGNLITSLGKDASSARNEEGPIQGESQEDEFKATAGLFSENTSDKLSKEDVNKYYPFDRRLLPEAFPSYYQIEVPDDVRKTEPKGGNKSLASEFKLSGRDNLLARESLLELMSELGTDDGGRRGKRILLHGRPGCGKSISLAATAEWARQKKWLVLYIPTAMVFGNDLFFNSRPGSVLYDTPNVAKTILRSVRDSHKDVLQEIKQELDLSEHEVDGSELGTTLLDLCDIGITAQQPAVTVDAAFKLLHELVYVKRNTPTLVLIDDYNALYWKTTYGRWVSDKCREMITIDHTKLGRAMRFLEKEEDDRLEACVVAAPTFSQGIRPNLWVPLAKNITKKDLDLFTPEDLKRMYCYYWNCGSIAPMEDGDVMKAWFLCGGNGHDMQKSLAVLG